MYILEHVTVDFRCPVPIPTIQTDTINIECLSCTVSLLPIKMFIFKAKRKSHVEDAALSYDLVFFLHYFVTDILPRISQEIHYESGRVSFFAMFPFRL